MPALDESKIRSLLGTAAPSIELMLVDRIDSTNQHLLMLADQGAPSGTCLVAQNQTAGRGRRGRSWLSDTEGSLTFSLLWRFPGPPATLSGLPLTASLAVARALDELGVDGVSLKWPNDVLRHGRKIAGVLVEISDPGDGCSGAVIGVGLNVALDESLADRLQNPATDIRNARGEAPEREKVLACILRQMVTLMREFSEKGFLSRRDEWLRRSTHHNRVIRLILPNHRVEIGEACGLAEDGALLLKQQDHIQRFVAGEISLRLD
jgi:BirA family biotin operon repressor/biotin-[acetyl-CoA-carboxylase] ligase